MDVFESRKQSQGTPSPGFSMKAVLSHKTQHLLSGYVSHRNLGISTFNIFPNDIKRLCSEYFSVVAAVSSLDDVHDDSLLALNGTAKEEVIEFVFCSLCPGTNYEVITENLKKLLSIIDALIAFENANSFKTMEPYHAMHLIYNSVLLEMHKLSAIDFHHILKNETIASIKLSHHKDRIYESQECKANELMIRVCRECDLERSRNKSKYNRLMLLRLFGGRSGHQYYDLFCSQSRRDFADNESTETRCEPSLEILDVFRFMIRNKVTFKRRDILRDCVLKDVIREFVLNGSERLETVWALLQRHSSANDFEKEIVYIYLIKEMEFIIDDANDGIPVEVDKMEMIEKIANNIDLERINSRNEDICVALVEKMCRLSLLDLLNINKFGVYSDLIVYSMRYNTMDGWALLETSVDKIQKSGKRYAFYDEIVYFVDSKPGLFKNNLVSNIQTLTGKVEGDKERAETEIAIKIHIMMKINKLILDGVVAGDRMNTFKKLYQRMKQTKCIKHILSNSDDYRAKAVIVP